MFDSSEMSVALATVAATGIILMLVLIKGIGSKDEDFRRYPPSIPTLSLIVSIFKEGVCSLPQIFMRYTEKHGPVMSCKMGGKLILILNDRKSVAETFLKQSETFADRFEFWEEKNVTNRDRRGIAFVRHNEAFKKYHKICLSILKEFGLGDNGVSETRILHEVELLIEEIVKTNGQAFDPKYMAAYSTSNVVLSILFCEQFMSVKKNRRALLQSSREFVSNLELALSMSPLLRFLPYFRKKINALSEGHRSFMRAIEEGIEVSKADKTEPTFVQRFLEIAGPDYNQQDLAYILRDLCIGSLETVSSTLLWAMVELANNMKIQTRLQREIDEVLANVYSTHMDPMTWKDPKNFDPERFFDTEGNFTGIDKLVPFGLGKRSCLGETIAKQELFLFLTSLVQRFDIRPPEDQDSIIATEVTAIGMHPSDFNVRLIPRRKF